VPAKGGGGGRAGAMMSRGSPWGAAMLNARMVNAAAVNFCHRVFARKVAVLARISRFENTVKYKTKSSVNHETVHFAGPAPADKFEMSH
jgi:hypothetical protein